MSAGPVKIGIQEIDATKRIRTIDKEEVAKLQKSIKERGGLLSPIEVREVKGGGYRLTTGAHRLKACEELGWQDIDAFVVNCSEDEALLREIDENLHRAELTPYDQAEFLALRWTIWNRRNGGSRHGGDRKSSSSKFFELEKAKEIPSFFEETARQLGVDETTVRLAVNRRVKTSDEIWYRLRGTDAAKKGILLDRIQRHQNPVSILDRAAREDKSVAAVLEEEAAKKRAAPKKPLTPKKMIKRVRAAWATWSEAQKTEFIAMIGGLP